MVDRVYNAPQLNVPDGRSISVQQVQGTGMRNTSNITAGNADWLSNALRELGNTATSTVNKLGELHRANQYLEGAAQVGVAKSEAELQSDPLTRDWMVAGYRDTLGKLAVVDAAAQFETDVKALAEKSPEDLQNYLRDRRSKLIPNIQGMSQEGRANAVGQMLMADRTATSKWTTEHAKFVIDKTTTALTAPFTQALGQLQNNQKLFAIGQASADNVVKSRDEAVSAIYNVTTSSLPKDAKDSAIKTMVQMAFNSGDTTVYEFLRNNRINGSTLLETLPAEDQLTLSKGYVSAQGKAGELLSIQYAQTVQSLKVSLDKENFTYTGSYNQLKSELDKLYTSNAISGEEYKTMTRMYIAGAADSGSRSALVNAAIAGDIRTQRNLGKTDKETATAVRKSMDKAGVAPTQRLITWRKVGENGNAEGYVELGKETGHAMMQILQHPEDAGVSADAREYFAAIHATMSELRESGKNFVIDQIYSGIEDAPTRAAVVRTVSAMQKGSPPQDALAAARRMAEQESKLTPDQRSSYSNKLTYEIDKLVRSDTASRGIIWSAMQAIGGLLPGVDSVNRSKIQPQSYISYADGYIGDTYGVQLQTQRLYAELKATASSIAVDMPLSSASEIVTMARAELAARTIRTTHGPLYLPAGMNPAKLVPPGVSPGGISAALDKLLVGTRDDSKFVLYVDQGVLTASEYGRDSPTPLQTFTITPDMLGTQIRKEEAATHSKNNVLWGNGTSKTFGNLKVRYNGENTAGVSPEFALYFRENLMQTEGFLKKARPDVGGRMNPKTGKPVMTVGIGISDTGDFYPKNIGPDGTVTADDHSIAFAGASNRALNIGVAVVEGAGLPNNKYSVAFFSELAYQSGDSFISRKDSVGAAYKAVVTNMVRGDVTATEEAFKKTPAYIKSGESRRAHYLRLIRAIL